ncbi:MAG TPA: metallophosphoesterase family protein [Labilithrix sp.]
MRRFALQAMLTAGFACSSGGSSPDQAATPPSADPGANAPPGGGGAGGGQQDPGMDTPSSDPWNPPVETGSVAFPYTPYRCGYSIRQVSPSKPAAIFHQAGAATAVKNLHLTIEGNASSSVVVQWSTDDATHATELRFGDSATSLDKTAHGFSFGYGVTNRREHEIHLCGLAPSHTYYYDAGSGTHSFTTAPDGATDVKLLVAGDSRSDPSVFGGYAAAALAKGPTAMILTGDAVAVGSDQSLWDELFSAAPDLFASVPAYWINGNHENLAEPYLAQLALPDHGGPTNLEEFYAATYGPLRIVALNDTTAATTITGTEATFLQGTLMAVDRTKTPFVIATHHQPMYTTSSSHTPDTSIRSAWSPLFDQYHVNAVFAGHVHSYESTLPMKAGAIATDATGTRYFNFGGAGAPLYGFSGTKPSYLVGQESTHGYAILDVSPTQMVWSAFRADGSAIETITIPK